MNIDRLSPKDFNTKLKTKEFILIDIRTYKEKLMYWYIEGTDHFFDVYMQESVGKINWLDKDKKYLIYCFHWNRTQSVLWYMKEQWFKCVYDLVWGIDYWKNDWFELIKD